MALTLKTYQVRALETLSAFLAAARGARSQEAMQAAFTAARQAVLGESTRPQPYRVIAKDTPEIPQVCIRIPTGGGKTMLAAHAIERAARDYVGTQAPLALWLVPTDIIRQQTLAALKTPGHDYREALLDHYPADRLLVIGIDEIEQLRAQDFGARAIVVVCTMQAFRVGVTASRDVYAYKECFEPHFARVGSEDFLEKVGADDLAAQPYLKPGDVGKVKKSFANLLALWRPIVIVDEAHNARSDLSFEVLKRIRPACVIEWTATPAKDQNVLYHVSAQELKAENMIKLPIVLSPHPNWQEAVRDAVLTREKLQNAAAGEADYVRPIVLFQADAVNGPAPVDTVKGFLVETLGIAADRIAVATGSQRGLDGVDLFDRACLIDFVITVEALKEGWDCSLAYVFCTVQRVRSAKDMEQLLGRVLRLPYARERKDAKLARAYAHVSAEATARVASELTDRLVSMGFEEIEAATYVQQSEIGDLFGETVAPAPPLVKTDLIVSEKVAEAIRVAAPEATTLNRTDAGMVVTVAGILPAAVLEAARTASKGKERDAVEAQLERHQAQAQAAAAPSQRGIVFARIPQLCVPVQGELILFEPEVLSELAELSLAGAPHDLPGFAKVDDAKPWLIDVAQGKLVFEQAQGEYLVDLNSGHEGVQRESVIRLLDRELRHDAILQPDMIAWLGRALDGLETQGIELTYCARHLNRLADVLRARLQAIIADGRTKAFRQALVAGTNGVRLDDFHAFTFKPGVYPASTFYNGSFTFKKHYYPRPGDLNDEIHAEETACAIEIESLSEVKCWVRNLERQPQHSFWLPTSTDRFYPDFVAELADGRILVVEYKGGDRYSNDDSKEKRTIGGVWAAASGGKCLFAMVTDARTAGNSVALQLRGAMG